MVRDVLKARMLAALQELTKLIKDKNKVPINYNHYYTDTIHKKRVKRIETQIERRTDPLQALLVDGESSGSEDSSEADMEEELASVVSESSDEATRDMEAFSCEESLDCLQAIYKVRSDPQIHWHLMSLHVKASAESSHVQVQQKVFLANVTTQVIERHLVEDLNNIFSPMVVLGMTDAKVQSIVSEPESTKRERVFLSDRIKRLEEGQEIFRGILDP